MTRVAGFLLLQLAALLFARRKIELEKKREKDAASFCAMLEQLFGLLECESAPLPELLHTLSKRSTEAAAVFAETLLHTLDRLGVCSFHELWNDALRSAGTAADAELLAILEEPGAILGRYELKTQLDAVSACIMALRQHVDQQRQNFAQTQRLTMGLSLLGSLLLGILLL